MADPTTDQKDELRARTTFACEIVSVTSKDDFTIAYSDCGLRLVIDDVTYEPYPPLTLSRYSLHEGLTEQDSSQLVTAFDPDNFTEADVRSGRWTGARLYTAFVVNYLDLSLGVVAEKKWFLGKWGIVGEQVTFELLSLSQPLQQTIGNDTSATDRRRTLAETGIDLAPHTHDAAVTVLTDRRRFTVDDVRADHYYRYGLATWTSGDNAGLSMEIKDNVGGAIELMLPMRSAIRVGDDVTLVRGYDGTRDAAKAIDPDLVVSFDGEPDIQPLTAVLKYPE
jgi:uncharacterized phage protein (TIGR02218 family)